MNIILAQHELWLKSEGKKGELAELLQADLRSVDLRGANLKGAKLKGALLHDALLDRADLSNADLSGANLRNTCFQGAIMDYATLDYAYFHGTDFRDAQLHGWFLQKTRFYKVRFDRANLAGSRLWSCKYPRTTISKSQLHQVQMNQSAVEWEEVASTVEEVLPSPSQAESQATEKKP